MKTLLSAAAFAVAIGTCASASATIIDATFTGTIKDGTDGLGLFGTAGADLTGLPFTLTIEYTTSLPGTYFSSPTINTLEGGSNFGLPDPIISSVLRVNGVSSPNVTGSFDTFNEGANGNSGAANQIAFSVAESSNHYSIGFSNSLGSITGDIPATLDVPLSFTPGPDDAGFGSFGFPSTISSTTGDFSPARLTYSIPTTGAPEPSTWAMMLLGFAGLGYAGYRKAREPRAA
jgi:hypothetical protein